jgi:hypothetical protein
MSGVGELCWKSNTNLSVGVARELLDEDEQHKEEQNRTSRRKERRAVEGSAKGAERAGTYSY